MGINKKYLIYSIEELKIVDTWDECSLLTKGIKGKQFKSFKIQDIDNMIEWFIEQISKNSKNKDSQFNELQDLFKDRDITPFLNRDYTTNNNKVINKTKRNLSSNDIMNIQDTIEKILSHDIMAFVDGSYNDTTKEYSYGMCVIQNDKIVYESYKSFSDNTGMRQINGELKGALLACEFAIRNNLKKIVIGYDYTGIEKFALKEWNSTKPIVKYYTNKMQQYLEFLEVEFIKIPSHKKIKWNEYADNLAKKALGI